MPEFFTIILSLFSFIFANHQNAATSMPALISPSAARQNAFLLNLKNPNSDKEKIETGPVRIWEAPFLELEAKAAIAVSLDGRKIYYQKNILDRLPMASLTKLMTANLALEYYNLDDVITVSKSATTREGERGDLRLGEKITVRSLLSLMLIQSSNGAAVALAEAWPKSQSADPKARYKAFIEEMNQKAKILGLDNTNFTNPDGSDESGHYSSVLDLARLMSYFAEHWPWALEILRTQEATVWSSNGKIEHKLVNPNDLLKENPAILGGKTGFTDQAQGCLALLVSGFGKDNIITVVLGSGDRFGETKRLLDWLKIAYKW